jgi:Domain of unknown function (DUF6532)
MGVVQGNLGRWNHPCCQEILSKFLFSDSSNSLGNKFTAKFGPPLTTELVAFGHTMVSLCLVNLQLLMEATHYLLSLGLPLS